MRKGLLKWTSTTRSYVFLLLGLLCELAPAAAQTVQQCAQEIPAYVDGNAYRVENNKFASSQPECISIDTATTNFTVTNSSIANPTNGTPGAYPSIYQGCHWGLCSSSSSLPLTVNGIASASTSWSTTQPNPAPSTDAWDVAYDLWFNRNPTTNTRPDGAELMVWLNHHPIGASPQPNGSPVDTVTINAITYQVWYRADVSPPYIAYEMTQGTASVSNLDLLAIINDATFNRHYIDPSWYLISVEAGFELWHGGAGLATNSFFFSATPGSNAVGGTGSGLSSAPLNIWWPTDGSLLSGTQPFKARLENIPLSSYKMFWSVDGGQLNLMTDNAAGGDHKEASVDLTGWTWRDAGDRYGPFLVTFTAQDLSGMNVQQRTISIYVVKSLSSAPLNIWWPTDGSVVSGIQPFKARLENIPLTSYTMYWSVDGGQLNLMTDNAAGGDHKEASVDLSGWTWRDAGSAYGPFSVTFSAKDQAGNPVESKTITIYRAK
jgi:hypothetical protein